MTDIRDSLAQVQELISELAEHASEGHDVYAYIRHSHRVERKCYEFLRTHGPELMKRLEGKDG